MERVHITLTDELLKKIDEERASTGESRSNFCRKAIVDYLRSLETMRMMPTMLGALPDIQKSLDTIKKITEQNKDIQLSKQLHLSDYVNS